MTTTSLFFPNLVNPIDKSSSNSAMISDSKFSQTSKGFHRKANWTSKGLIKKSCLCSMYRTDGCQVRRLWHPLPHATSPFTPSYWYYSSHPPRRILQAFPTRRFERIQEVPSWRCTCTSLTQLGHMRFCTTRGTARDGGSSSCTFSDLCKRILLKVSMILAI
jgi:hypothetical protein